VIQKVAQKVARRQSQILGSQRLPKVANWRFFAQSGNPDNLPNSPELLKVRKVPNSKLLESIGVGLFTGRMPFLLPNQQSESTDVTKHITSDKST